jgi:hypothetical protein
MMEVLVDSHPIFKFKALQLRRTGAEPLLTLRSNDQEQAGALA